MHLQALLRFYRDGGCLKKAAPMPWRLIGQLTLAGLAAFAAYASWLWQLHWPIAAVVLGVVSVLFYLLALRSRNLQLAFVAKLPVASFSDRVAVVAQLQHDKLLDFLRNREQATINHVDSLLEAVRFEYDLAEKRSPSIQWASKIVVTLLTGLVLVLAGASIRSGNVDGAVDLISGAVIVTLQLMGLWIAVGWTFQDVVLRQQRELERLTAALLDIRVTLCSA